MGDLMQVVSTIIAEKICQIGKGQGRNSEVYLAHDPQLNGKIALKEIPINEFPDSTKYFSEAQKVYQNKHRHVVPVLYAARDTDKIRIAMPYFKNGTVQDVLNKEYLTVNQILIWSYQFLLGLHHIHSNGYIHFDLKPSNLLIHDDGSVMVSDFGQSQEVNDLGVAENPRMYLMHFPPEVFLYSKSTKQADIYQAGLTLYRMCNGDEFFKSQKPLDVYELRDKVLNGKFPDRKKFLPHIPSRLKRIIRKALKVDPSERYQTAMDMINDLGQVDPLQDWKYFKLQNGVKWISRNYDHQYVIKIEEIKGSWHIIGYTIRLADGLKRLRKSWCGGPYNTYLQAMDAASKIFKRMEEG